MDFYDVIRNRRSVRAYKGDAIKPDSLQRIGEALRAAPSACNLQPWEFRVVLNPDMRKKICGVYSQPWLAQAPAIVAAIGNTAAAWKRREGTSIIDMDVGVAMEHVVLAAEAEGLGTCWICAYEIEKMNKALGVEPPLTVLAISPLGYPVQKGSQPPRRPLEHLFKVVE